MRTLDIRQSIPHRFDPVANPATSTQPIGFCYVADSKAYLDEAICSIRTLRVHSPTLPIAVVTHPGLFRAEATVTNWVALQQSRRGPIVKADAWLAPYDRVVFLDTDTLITGNLADVFALLDKFDFVSVAEPNARPDRGIEDGVPEAYPEQNSGFFAFARNELTSRLFESWLKEYDLLHDRHGVTANQPSLRIALWKSDIRHLTLGGEYNLLLHTNPSVSREVKVVHDRSPDRERLAKSVNRDVGPRAVVAGFGPVFGFFTRRGWTRQYVRLTWHFFRILLRPGLVRQQGHPLIWWRAGIDD